MAASCRCDVPPKAKGFAGTMKRHGFRGQGASHGAQGGAPSGLHRRMPRRRVVFMGTRMAGRMGTTG